MNDPSQQHIGTPALIRRFAPYLMRYKRILIFDLFCAALTTLCDIVLPKIMSYLTNAATDPGIVLTVDAVLKLALLYLILRLIDGAAQYFMSGTGHIMGVYIETDMRRDAFAHLQRLTPEAPARPTGRRDPGWRPDTPPCTGDPPGRTVQ